MSFTPKHPNWWAAAVCTAFVAVLTWPLATGQYLVGPASDQYAVGYAFRQFGAEYFRQHGAVPQWNPYMFGGLPFVAAQHGDIFYPTALLRLLVPADLALGLAFAIHLALAGLFTYLFLKAWNLPWLAATTGGLAYQLTGQVASLVHPGHDGKIFASALLPLALLALTRAVRDRRGWAYGLWALVVGGVVLAHPQLCYYLLIAAGLFTLYLVFVDPSGPKGVRWWQPLALALVGVILGFGIAAIQVLPFAAYIPFSPRTAAGSVFSGWGYATSWSLPPEELLNTVVPQFSGLLEHYWGRNFFKYHTEYLGVVVLMLAVLGWGNVERRRLLVATAVIGGFFLLVSLGGHTPFFRLLYVLLPGIKLLRAHSMAFSLVAFVVAVWAAFGVEVAARDPGRARRHAVIWAGALAGAVVLAAAGVWTALGEALGEAVVDQQLTAQRGYSSVSAALAANQSSLLLGTVRSAAAATALAALLWATERGRLKGSLAGLLLLAIVGLDLWSVDRRFFVFSPPARQLYARDAVLDSLIARPKPFRVWDVPDAYGRSAYRNGSLMIFSIQDALGHHGNEVKYYDELLGGKNQWRYLLSGSPKLWRELGITHLILPQPLEIAGWRQVVGPVSTYSGGTAYLYESQEPVPYAAVVPRAAKLPDEQILPTFYDERFDPTRILLLPDEAPVNPAPLDGLPPPSTVQARVTEWEAGRMTVRLDPAPEAPAYLRVAETYYPDWRATVDGEPAPVLRGQYALVAVPLPAGAREVRLVFRSDRYGLGRLVTLGSLVVAALTIAVPVARRRKLDG